jgi:hypothetical protein
VSLLRERASLAAILLTLPLAVLAGDHPTDDSWYFTFQIENKTGDAVHVRVIEGGEAIIDVVLPRSLKEINEAEGYVDPDPNPVSLRRVSFPLHESTETLDVEATSSGTLHGSFSVASFTKRPDLDFRIVVSKTGIGLTQDFEMPDDLTEEEHQLPLQEQLDRRALERRTHPQVRIYLLNKSGRPISLALRVDGHEVVNGQIPGERPSSSEGHLVHDPGCPSAQRVIRLNPRSKTLEVDESTLLKMKRTFQIKDFDVSGGGDFCVIVTAASIEVMRGTFPY